MEMTRAEATAVAAVDGMPAELLDAMGRLVVTPHALTTEGQRNVPADLHPGESLAVFLARHVPGIESGAWVVSIGGAMVPRAMWGRVYPKHGMHIACRAVVAKQAVALVAVAVLSYFTMGMGGFAAGSFMGLTGAAGFAAAMGVFVAGSMLINKVLAPKVASAGATAAARQVYSLSAQRNSARAYEPLPTLFGEMRVTPDLSAQSYTWYAGDEQYLGVRLLGGINVHSASDLSIGETALTDFHAVETYFNSLPGHPHQEIPLAGNVDAIAGGELPDNPNTAVVRTSSKDAIALGVDLEYMAFHQGEAGVESANIQVTVEYAAAGSNNWVLVQNTLLHGNDTSPRRVSWQFGVPAGQYDVRVQRSPKGGDDKTTRQVTWTSLRSIQPDTTDYSQWGCIGIKIKATGQISGSLDTLRATYRARPIPVWNGLEWVMATTREEGLSNPGAILLQTLRGVYARDRGGKLVLQWGYGMSDAQIDIEGFKAFMLHCKAKGYTYDRWITGQMSLQQFCDEVALAGMGQFTWTDGSRPTVVFVGSGQPISAVVNMANMKKASFSVDYALSNAADGIEYQYLDRNTWETKTLRVTAPGVTTMLNPARVTGEGVTSEAHAAVLARYHLAQSIYQFKTVNFQADIEHLDYRRLSVLSVSHDLTQWGFGGRVMGAEIVGGKIRLQLDEPVPVLSTPHLGLRIPGERDYRVWPMTPMAEASDVVELVGNWPAGVPFPGDALDNPAHDTLWCADFKPTPGYRVRVTSIEPEKDLSGAAVTCVPEGPEFWNYVLNGTYVPAPNSSSIPQLGRPTVRDLRVQEQVNLQGDTEWYELHVQWEVEGDYDHAQVWAGRDGSELRLVDGRATGSRSTFRIDGAGEWLIDVRPFNSSGQVGRSAQLLYITTATQIPPRNVDQFVVQRLAGGLRRFAWQYSADKPPAFAGVQIRYVPGDVALSTADWGSMTPLGDAADIYSAQFETTRPQAGLWTFGCRTIDTAGQLSSGIRRFAIQLDDSFEQVQQPDLAPPPAPTGVTAAGLFSSVQVVWDAPLYTMGHGHARTEIWAGETDDAQAAEKVAEGYSGPESFDWGLGSTTYVWARHVTKDGVAGPFSELAIAQTAEDVEQLLDVLEGQITEGQLYGDLTKRIDAIDKNSPELGVSLIEAAGAQAVAHQQTRGEIDRLAVDMLQAVLAADSALETVTDAGFYIEPGTGLVKLHGLEVEKGKVTNIEVLLDALQGQLALKATTAYVDGRIAESVLSPADLILYEGLDGRIIHVATQLDSINGTLAQKANQLELTGALVRLTSAENTLDALNGQIALRVTRAEYEADQDAVAARLSSAEILLNSLDAPSIVATVQAASNVERDAEKHAQALLQDILTGERNREKANEALAFARSELSAAIQEGLQAEAAQRTQLAAQMGQAVAVLEQESSVQASAAGHAAAQYTARMQLTSNGQWAAGGWGMTGSSSANAGPTLDFGVLANKFFVAPPVGSGITSNFQLTVQTTPITSNGVTIPAGLYVDSIFVTNVDALWGRFGNLRADTIQATAISASQLTAGSGVIGGSLKSANYVSGGSGWILRPDGVAEFSGVIVRGTIYATSGSIGGITINSNGLNAGAYAGYAWPAGTGTGFHLGPNGLLMGNYSTGRYLQLTADGALYAPGLSIDQNGARFSGSLAAATGTFSGQLDGASGNFSGVLTAHAINAVSTINIAGNSITVPLMVSGSSWASGRIYIPYGGSISVIFGAQIPEGQTSSSARTVTLYVNGGWAQNAMAAYSSSGNSTAASAWVGYVNPGYVDISVSCPSSVSIFAAATASMR